MRRRFPDIEVEYYPVDKDLTCHYPEFVNWGELLVFIHYFGHENKCELPKSGGTVLEDVSHSYASLIPHRGDYVFGSLRKILRIGDGGFINTYFNPIYEGSKKLDAWLRYEAEGWPDMREAENMLDRNWRITDISSQSLIRVLSADYPHIRNQRQVNERFLMDNIAVGAPLLVYRPNECPLLHSRVFETRAERDSLREFLAERNIFTSIHWPIHEDVRNSDCDIEGALWLESHSFSVPVAQEYGVEHMEYVCKAIQEWQKSG